MADRVVHVRVDADYVARHDASEVIDPVFWSVNIYDGPGPYEATLARFTTSQRRALGVFWYQAEVDNGGHTQFFSNSTGIVWKDALAGLEAMGLDAYAAVLREAARRLGGDPPLDRAARETLLDACDEGFDDLDRRFYALERERDLGAAMTDWIRAHPDDFAFEGLVQKP